ncbi:DNA polymerase III subunit delta' [Congregibacter litoralis]|uniref:DNA-directed DNA polymerase n=1 Tax=Congregibacter litoralis KT71 TaxID=314285 RepID=A4A8H5_9GAMM|nr:DNA polymerase III subunit delta' [Congregibacter litoralis]EAQ97970.2 DNA polymerase III, gamma/tau subunit [Congregibacter litoralis KT71]
MPELPPTIIPPPQSRTLPWHQSAWRSLHTLFQGGRLPHAMLLEGQPGTGRNRLALALARFLLCSQPGVEGNCGECKTCTLSASGALPDLLSVGPAEEGKAIGINAIREVIRFAAGTPSLGRYKVILITPAESLTTAAFNAFLKCLEEPASETFIILVSARGFPLPATIRSRCQRWQLPSPEEEAAQEWLKKELGQQAEADGAASAMLELCNGRPLDALSKLQGEEREPLLAMHRCAREVLHQGRKSTLLEQAVAGVEPDSALDAMESALQRWLRELPAARLRTVEAQRGFGALDTIGRLRAAKRSGTNPNVDLLRFSATSALNGLWE